MVHIYVKAEEDKHTLNDGGNTCMCVPRVRILSDGTMLCIHSPFNSGINEMSDEFIDSVLNNVEDTDDNIQVEDV